MRPAASHTLTRRALAALALALVLTVGGAPAVLAQETPPTTTSGVLVPGSTAPPTSAAPASTTTTQAPAEDENGGFLDLDANEKVWVIVGALVGVAILMLILTVLYWRHTQPGRSTSDRRPTRAERKQQKRRRKATSKDPFREDDEVPSTDEPSTDDPSTDDPPTGPMDLDELLGSPDPSRSVFGSSDEDFDPGR